METELPSIGMKLRNTRPKWSVGWWLLWSMGAIVFSATTIMTREAHRIEDYLFISFFSVLLGFGIATFYYTIWFLIKWLLNFTIDRRVSVAGLSSKIEQLQDNLEADFFNNLVNLNFKYLDRYYLQTQIQANKSFLVSVVASLVGFAIIITGITMMYLGNTEPAYVTTGTGLVSEFIAAVFFYLYNRTIIKMSEYHQKLVLTQNIALALKISQGLPEPDRVKTQMSLVSSLTTDINNYLTIQPFSMNDNSLETRDSMM